MWLTTETSFKAHMTSDFMSAFLQHVGLLKVFLLLGDKLLTSHCFTTERR